MIYEHTLMFSDHKFQTLSLASEKVAFLSTKIWPLPKTKYISKTFSNIIKHFQTLSNIIKSYQMTNILAFYSFYWICKLHSFLVVIYITLLQGNWITHFLDLKRHEWQKTNMMYVSKCSDINKHIIKINKYQNIVK